MLRDVLTEEELKALLGSDAGGFAGGGGPAGKPAAAWDGDDKKLLHALVRNQLRLLHMIEEMQAELRLLKSAALGDSARREASAGLEPLPLPFMRQGGAGSADGHEDDDAQKAPAAEVSRKERFKRKSLW